MTDFEFIVNFTASVLFATEEIWGRLVEAAESPYTDEMRCHVAYLKALVTTGNI